MVSAVIMDFDDTIVQTSRFRRNLLAVAIQDLCRISREEDLSFDHGKPFRKMIEEFIQVEEFDQFIKQYLKYMSKRPTEPCVGAQYFLQTLHQRHIPVVILSSSHRKLIEHDLRVTGLLDFIDYIFDSEMIIETPKPDPRAIQLPVKWLNEKYNIISQQCVYVGDSLDDMRSSHGKTDFFAVLSGSTSKEEFITNGLSEDKIVKNLIELSWKFFPLFQA